MSIDKKIDYVAQDGVKNYVKNSPSVTVPKKFKARKDAPAVKLAYITDAEAKMLKTKKKGTPHKGPKGIPSYDSFDAEGNFTSGAAMSAAETGSRDSRDRAEVRASNIGGPKGLAPGVTSNQARDLRSAFIAAGGGQRVNPGFFDSRNTVSPAELARARAFNPAAFRAGRRGGIMDFITGGGFLGNLVRGIGQKFGLGKTYNQPTYDVSGGNNLGLFGQVPEDFENDPKISNVSFTQTNDGEIQRKYNEYLLDAPPNPLTFNEFKNAVEGISTRPVVNLTSGAKDGIMQVADATTFPTFDGSGISLMNRSILRNAGYNDRQIKEAQDGGYLDLLIKDVQGPIPVV
jgi:hypothetical protein